MRLRSSLPLRTFLVAFLLTLTFTRVLRAQTLEVQTRAEAELWFQRWLQRVTAPESRPVLIVFVVIAAALLVLLVVWRWLARRKRGREA